MITSNSALKSSEYELFNAGSTIKNGHFFADMKPFEIKVPNPEISEILKNVNFMHQQNSLFESKSTKMNRIIWRLKTKLKLFRHLSTNSSWIMKLWAVPLWYEVPLKQFKSRPFKFAAFCRSKKIRISLQFFFGGF